MYDDKSRTGKSVDQSMFKIIQSLLILYKMLFRKRLACPIESLISGF